VRARLLALAAIAGSAVAFAFYARVAWPWVVLGWCGLVPWLAALDRAPTLARALGSGLLMCEAFVLAVFFWFAQAIANYTGEPLALGVAALLALGPLLQPQFLVFAGVRHLARRRQAGVWPLALVGACAYVGAEWACPKLFADTIGHGLYASAWMRQAADIGGAPALTFVLVTANACAWAALQALLRPSDGRAPLRAAGAPLAAVALLAAALLGYGAWRYRTAAPLGAAPLRAGIVQADISHYEELRRDLGTYDAVLFILTAYFDLSRTLLRDAAPALDLLLWPETVYPTTFGAPKSPEGAQFDRSISDFVTGAGVPLVFGTYDLEAGAEFNAAVFLQPSADQPPRVAIYRKTSLFPLTERVPALLELPLLRRWLPWLGTWKPGAGPRVLPVRLADGRTLRIAPLICYDAVDPQLAIDAARQGAEVIVTLSNDAWFATGGGPRLHLIVSAFRSIETRRPQVRATNTGISAVIDANGEMLGTIGVDVRGVLAGSVLPTHAVSTLMVQWGDWFGRAACAAGCALLLFMLWRNWVS
jgi:apolipoprotein N-acyltransferase